MSNTVINARIIDQKVQLSNIPLIASGSQGVLQIKCDFDDLWTGYQATAVFFREEKGKVTDVFHVPVYLGIADVPPEVLKDEGHFFMGFMGVAENTRTTELFRLEVKRGAITEGIAVPDPTPDVYTQLLEILNQSGIIPDATLTQEGKAADAKATGEAIENVRTDAAQMVAEAKDELLTDLQAADYIIEWGIEPSTDEYSGNWYWEKWASGKAVCWGKFNFGDVACDTEWGSMRQSAVKVKNFPNDFFRDTPYWDVSIINAGGGAWITQQYTENNLASSVDTGGFYLTRPTSFTMKNVVLGFSAIGRWKADEEVIANGAD